MCLLNGCTACIVHVYRSYLRPRLASKSQLQRYWCALHADDDPLRLPQGIVVAMPFSGSGACACLEAPSILQRLLCFVTMNQQSVLQISYSARSGKRRQGKQQQRPTAVVRFKRIAFIAGCVALEAALEACAVTIARFRPGCYHWLEEAVSLLRHGNTARCIVPSSSLVVPDRSGDATVVSQGDSRPL